MQLETDQCLLVIVADTDIRDELADFLLSHAEHTVFSSEPVDCHGIDPHSLNLAEQVAGRQGKVLLQVQTTLTRARNICQELLHAFPGAELRYWIQPVLEAGLLGERALTESETAAK